MFVDATGHVTDAERYEWSFVFAGLLPDDFEDNACGRANAVVAAGLRRELAPPEGPQSSVDGREDHPVIHVSWQRRDRVRGVGGQAPAHRGRVGVRGARRSRRAAVPVGQRPRTRRRAPR